MKDFLRFVGASFALLTVVSIFVYCSAPHTPVSEAAVKTGRGPAIVPEDPLAPKDQELYDAMYKLSRERAKEWFQQPSSTSLYPVVILRHQMFAARLGRIDFDLAGGDATLVLFNFTHKTHTAWHASGMLSDRQIPALKGRYRFDEALDVLLKGLGCRWSPMDEIYATIECDPVG